MAGFQNGRIDCTSLMLQFCRSAILQFPETDLVRFGPEEGHDRDTEHHGKSDAGHRAAVTEMLAKNCLERWNAGRQCSAELIGKPGKDAPITRRSQFVDVGGNDAPTALH